MLWDMTSEKDVVEFLVENDFLRMAQFTVKISEEPRLTVADIFKIPLSIIILLPVLIIYNLS